MGEERKTLPNSADSKRKGPEARTCWLWGKIRVCVKGVGVTRRRAPISCGFGKLQGLLVSMTQRVVAGFGATRLALLCRGGTVDVREARGSDGGAAEMVASGQILTNSECGANRIC